VQQTERLLTAGYGTYACPNNKQRGSKAGRDRHACDAHVKNHLPIKFQTYGYSYAIYYRIHNPLYL